MAIALGYSRRMMGQAWLMGVVAALVALVVSLAMSWFLDGSLQRDAWFRAIAIGIGVGLGIAVVRRLYGSRLHRNAKETLGM